MNGFISSRRWWTRSHGWTFLPEYHPRLTPLTNGPRLRPSPFGGFQVIFIPCSFRNPYIHFRSLRHWKRGRRMASGFIRNLRGHYASLTRRPNRQSPIANFISLRPSASDGLRRVRRKCYASYLSHWKKTWLRNIHACKSTFQRLSPYHKRLRGRCYLGWH